MTIDISIEIDEEEAEAARAELLALRLLEQFGGAVELLTVELGRRLGLYAVLAGTGAVTATELATHASIAPRYALEWLDQQAAAGIVDVAGTDASGARRFVLPRGHQAALLDPESPAYLVGAAPLVRAVAASLPAVADAYATGTGVEYGDFGHELRFGIAELNRPGFALDIRDWVGHLPDVAARLEHGGVILDAGCGEGWSSIGLARAFPRARVVGVDLDVASVRAARDHVARAGLEGRVTVWRANAAEADLLHELAGEPVTLVTVFQALHDMGEPVRALTGFRALLAEGGAVLVADEHGDDVKSSPADEVERQQLAMSVLHCLPATWAESDNVVNGTVLRSHTLSSWVGAAGFARHEVLPVEHPFWRFHRLG
jgi:SAM-dependent methyltransferase